MALLASTLAKGAFATLLVGCVLGLVAFAVLKFPGLEAFRKSLPIYLQNKLNIGFMNTAICALVMLVVSHLSEYTEADQAKAESIRQSGRAMPMTRRETATYGLFITTLIMIWLIVLLFFSPAGVA